MFHVVIGCVHEITLSKTQTLPDGRVKQCDAEGVSEIEYQLVTLPRFTSLLHGYDIVIIGHLYHLHYHACMVWHHRIFWTTSSMLLTPITTAFRRQRQLVIRQTLPSTVGDCSFLMASGHLWNSLPPDVTSAPMLTVSELPKNFFLIIPS